MKLVIGMLIIAAVNVVANIAFCRAAAKDNNFDKYFDDDK